MERDWTEAFSLSGSLWGGVKEVLEDCSSLPDVVHLERVQN